MHVAIRADADPSIGSGHVVRCLALAEEGLALGHRVVLHSHRLPPALREWAADLSVDIVEVEEPPGSAADARLLLDTAADVHLVDGYRFGASFHDEHAAATPRPILVVVDDNREVPVTHADLVLNPGAHADGSLYADLAPDRLAIGPDHAIIRRSIAGIDPGRPDPPSGRPRRLLVSLGGGDPLGLTDRLLDAMLPFDDIEVRVTRGGLVADGPDGDIVARGEGVTAVTGDLADSLAWADLAILGAGTSLWEAAHLGLPVIAVVVADNQTATSESARKAGFALRRDGRDANAIPDTLADVRSLLFDRNRLDAMSDAGRRLIDGRGVSRVWERLEGMVTTAPGDDGISFRPLVDGDRERLFDWRNRPEVARHLFGPTPIARPDHDRWFDRLSGDRSRRSWIVEADDRPVGLVNLTGITEPGGTCVWGGYVADPQDRGRGVGRLMVDFGLDQAFETLGVENVTLEAYVDNEAAVSLYRSVGFTTVGERTEGDRLVLLMEVDRDRRHDALPGRGHSLTDSTGPRPRDR